MFQWFMRLFRVQTVTKWNFAHDEQSTFYADQKYAIVHECPICRVTTRQYLKVGGGRVCNYCGNSWHQADLINLSEGLDNAAQ